MNRERIDELWPPCGPCGFCGGPDKRHRTFDAIRVRHEAGESLEELAADYGTVDHILAALEWEPEITAKDIEAHALEALVQEWLSDPESMPDVRREALLDAARDVAGSGGVPAWLEFEREHGLSPRDAWRLAEEAGFGT